MSTANRNMNAIIVAKAASYTLAVAIREYGGFQGPLNSIQEDLETHLIYLLVLQPNCRWGKARRLFKKLAVSTDSYERSFEGNGHASKLESQLAFGPYEYGLSTYARDLIDLKHLLEIAVRSNAKLDRIPLRSEVVAFVARHTYFLFREIRKQRDETIMDCRKLLKELSDSPRLDLF